MNQIKHQIEMSSSSSNATRGASSSYTYGIPGSQVTISLSKGGNHSLTLSRGSADKPFCKVCYDAGLPVADYTNHFVKDQPGPGGKVVCPTLLAQKCRTCGIAGHTSSYCPGSRVVVVVDPDRSARLREEREQAKKANGGWETVGSSSKSKPRIEDFKPKTVAPAPAPAASTSSKYGSFGILAVDEPSSSSEDERQETPAATAAAPAPVRDPTKPLTWAQRAAAAASKPIPSSAPAPTQSKLLGDTRFALHHAVCENIPISKRAPPRGTSSESSNKRKQESVTVPA